MPHEAHHKLGSPGSYNGDFFTQVAMGLVEGYQFHHKYGINPAVVAAEEDLWQAGGLYPWLTAPEFLTVESSSVNDTEGGTGAHNITIEGLDENWLLQSEDIALQGTTPVQTTKTFIRTFRAYVHDSLNRVGQDGTISITSVTTDQLQAIIEPENNQTLMAIYTVPKDKALLIYSANVSSGNLNNTSPIRFVFYSKENHPKGNDQEPKRVRRSTYNMKTATYATFPTPFLIPPMTDIWIATQGNTTASPVSAEWHGIIADLARFPALENYLT